MKADPRLVLACGALLVAGCTLQPKYVRPDLPTAATFPETGVADSASLSAVQLPWREAFRDPALVRLIELALDNNRDMRVSVARIAEARGQYRIERSYVLPTPEIVASQTRQRTVDTSGMFGPGGAAFSSRRYDVNVGLNAFEIDFWGRVRSLKDAARSEFLATVAARRAFQISLIADVAGTYLVERELDARIALSRATLKAREEGLEIARLRRDAGVTSALDYRQTETLLTQAQTEVAALERQRAQTRTTLEVLIGTPVPADLPPATPLSAQTVMPDMAAGLPSDLLVNRPDIMAAEERLRAANANIGAARANFLPKISLTAAFGFASRDLDGLFSDDNQAWSYSPRVTVPLFSWDRSMGNLSAVKARRDIAVAEYEKAIQTAFKEVADALAAKKWLSEQAAAQGRALAAQRDRAELADLRYRNGVAGYLEVLDAQRELFAAEQALIAVERERLSNDVALYAALGGGGDEAPSAR